MTTDPAARVAELERENAKLRKIRDVLVRRVERSMDLQGSEFALFERATLLEAQVRKRTAQLEQALTELQRSHQAGSVSSRAKMPPQCEMLRFRPLMDAIYGVITWKWRES